MTEINGLDRGVALLLVVAAPLLVLPTLVVVAASAASRALFGADPAAALMQSHCAALAVIKIMAGCTLGLLAVTGLLALAM
jgi:hypothetical protein